MSAMDTAMAQLAAAIAEENAAKAAAKAAADQAAANQLLVAQHLAAQSGHTLVPTTPAASVNSVAPVVVDASAPVAPVVVDASAPVAPVTPPVTEVVTPARSTVTSMVKDSFEERSGLSMVVVAVAVLIAFLAVIIGYVNLESIEVSLYGGSHEGFGPLFLIAIGAMVLGLGLLIATMFGQTHEERSSSTTTSTDSASVDASAATATPPTRVVL